MSGIFLAKFDELEAMMEDERASIDLIIPSFRIKRSHKKSRLGCVNCKRRRVKVSWLRERGIDRGRRHTYLIHSVTRSSLAAIGVGSAA